MTSLFVFIGIVIAFALSVYFWNIIQRKKGVAEKEATPSILTRSEGCCGAHEVCDKTEDELKVKPKPVYFDDEELDRFSHKPSHEYSDEEAEEFSEIFYSMYDEEKHEWLISLRQRHISLPNQVKQEMLKMMKAIQKKHQTA